MEAIQKRMAAALTGSIWFAMGQVGSLMIIVGSLSPFWHAVFWPGLIILACTIVWMLWQKRSKSVSYAIVGLAILLGLWIIVNGFVGAAPAPALAEAHHLGAAFQAALAAGNVPGALGALAGMMEPAIGAGLAMGLTAAGAAIAVLGSIIGILSARSME